MIKNEREYRIAKAQVDKFEENLTKTKSNGKTPIEKLQRDALMSQIGDLKTEIQEYADIWGSKQPIPELESFDDLPSALIKARLAQGLSQKDLADRLGVAEQQIQRYESSNYETASLARIKELVEALDLSVSRPIPNPSQVPTLSGFITKLRRSGLDREFITKKLLPPSVLQAEDLDSPLKQQGLQVVEQVGRIFHLTSEQTFSREPFHLDSSSLGAKFKLRPHVRNSQLAVHAFYAQYLTMLAIQSVQHLPSEHIPSDPYRIHRQINDQDELSVFEASLRFIWKLGVPVIPIADSSVFQGAYFRESNRNAIVVKDRTLSDVRWMFDLFHEIWHASLHQDAPSMRILQFENIRYVTSKSNQPDQEEIDASSFASAVLLGRNPDDLAQECVKLAGGRISRLKQAVIDVALTNKVSIPALANCVAFRLSQEQDKDWWGAAENLQEPRHDIQRIARDILLEFVDLSHVGGPDLDLLRRGLGYTEVSK